MLMVDILSTIIQKLNIPTIYSDYIFLTIYI